MKKGRRIKKLHENRKCKKKMAGKKRLKQNRENQSQKNNCIYVCKINDKDKKWRHSVIY